MTLPPWWSKLTESTQQWLIHHVGEPLPHEMIDELVAAGVGIHSDAWWPGFQTGPTGFYVSAAIEEWLDEPNDEGSPAPTR